MLKFNKNERGITLLALAVTIAVLLILTGITIAAISGNNGIIGKATEAKDAAIQDKLEGIVKMAVTTCMVQNKGDESKVTPADVIAEIKKSYPEYPGVYAKSVIFPTQIIFPEEGNRKVAVNEIANESHYSVAGAEDNIAPTDLFEYEIISTGTVGSVSTTSLPTKEARILRIKPEYCNARGYNPHTDTCDLVDTNYEIKHEGITDTLVIPYQVEIDGEMYTITEVSLLVQSRRMELL